MLIVLGRPGSGRSTFLKTIPDPWLHRRFHLRQYQRIPEETMHKEFRGEVIYNVDIDIHFPHLSVGDTLLFAPKARVPRTSLGGVTRDAYAKHMRDLVMAICGLTHTLINKVGSGLILGVSGLFSLASLILPSPSVLETVQVIFFSVSSYSRFVKLFGKPQTNLVWADSLQLLCAYLSAFVVQLFFANRIIKLTKGRGKLSVKAFGIYVILALAFIEILAGITQVAWTYQIRSYLKLDQTKAVTTIQSAASLACDVLITTYLCLFLKNQKGEMMKTNNMVDALVYDAINRGTLTALSSFATMVLFLVLPDTFWFFLGLAPSSKLYMNSMLATLNTRQRIRNKIDAGDKGWNSIGNSIPLSTLQIGNKNASGQSQSIPSIAAVDLETGSVDMCRKREEYPASAV
ncbi:hypothetical protein C8R43DRAFT_1230218 [Mycena crocata]|nr:hypothetical protein C8R43DRAFT_1230218 [Mycena crocata]